MDRTHLIAVSVTALIACSPLPAVADDDAERLEFFEKKIRPVLVEHCYSCHSAKSDAVKGGLLLDSAPATLQGGDSGAAVVPGQPEESLLLSALKYESYEMPPEGKLDDKIIADFEKWITHGAADPRTAEDHPTSVAAEIDIEAGRSFWAFQPPKRSATLDEQPDPPQDSARIDALVERRLQQQGLKPNSFADRRTLLRRLTFDLTGLPPSDQQVQQFCRDESEVTVEQLVDQLLTSQAYGQKWARMWLDVARYAEDQAHIVGSNKSLFYPNAWMYRSWVIDALNDDLPYDDFVRLQLAADLMEPDNDDVQPALGFMGLGPKYYRRNDPEVMAEEWEDRIDVVSRGLLGLTVACARCHDHKYDPVRTEDYYALAGVFASTEMYNRPLTDEVDPKEAAKDPSKTLHVIRDSKPQDLAVMIRGKVDQRGDVVPRGFPEVLFPGSARQFTEGSGRAELAEAIVDRGNPLTARVIVNRIWARYFGTGLVPTLSNFGQLGELPSHPELLDDLAVRFMENGWSLKWLHRQIVLSDAYQRSSAQNAESMQVDPTNRWLWRMPRRRLTVEMWRDAVLTASGRLDHEPVEASINPGDPEQTGRTIYSEVSRFELNPLLARFDFPDPNVHSARRIETNTPLQKLFLLNSPFMLQQSEFLADRIQQEFDSDSDQAEALFRICLQRSPDAAELQAATKLIAQDGLARIAQSLIACNEFWHLD